MDKQKKEIKRIIDDRCEAKLGQVHTNNGNVTKTVDTSLIAKDIYNAGYRKIPEGAVVFIPTEEKYAILSQKEYERLCDLAYFGNGEETIRKETAEKFAERVKMAFYYHFDELIPSIMADKIDEICKEISEGK